MKRTIIIVGAGIGGLAAAARLARAGCHVRVLEARATPGGLASDVEFDGFAFDAGPYILLDRSGLEWAFREIGLELAERVALQRIEDVYEVGGPEIGRIRFHSQLEQTAANMERNWPGSGLRYAELVRQLLGVWQRLQPLQRLSRPSLLDLIRTGAWTEIPFLLRSLHSVLSRAGLPEPVVNALAIWTHVAGQRLQAAPSPLALGAAVIHSVGAYYPAGGIGVIPRVLAEVAQAQGADLQFGVRVASIRSERGRVIGVETEAGAFLSADVVVSNAGVGTYLELLEGLPTRSKQLLQRLPLQSPGVCAYLAVRGKPCPPYLRFHLPGNGSLCRLFVSPAVIAPALQRDGWLPARLIAPTDHEWAERVGPDGQRAYLGAILEESWWKEQLDEYRVLATRIPADWGAQFHLYRDSMNPVMTARFMRSGRLAHRSPYVRGLYLAGSSTHPGQWVSFCAISGVLAADRVIKDLS